MARGRTERVLVRRCDGADHARVPDELIVEEPLELRLDDHLVMTTMRTPGHDFELAVGFCVSEGLFGDAEVREVRYCGTGSAVETEFNVVTVQTGGRAPAPVARLASAGTSCGVCGSVAIEQLCDRLVPVEPAAFDPGVLAAVLDGARARQELFAATGAVHAAATFDPRTGEVGVLREDAGRHNAVDKVVGRLHLDGALPASGLGLYVSGRASFEIVQKAWAAGFGVVAAVSAPSSLAVEVAQRAGIVLAGFVREGRVNLYTEVSAAVRP